MLPFEARFESGFEGGGTPPQPWSSTTVLGGGRRDTPPFLGGGRPDTPSPPKHQKRGGRTPHPREHIPVENCWQPTTLYGLEVWGAYLLEVDCASAKKVQTLLPQPIIKCKQIMPKQIILAKFNTKPF